MITHILSIYAKGSLILSGEFESKDAAWSAAHAILRANPSRYTCVVRSV